MLQVFVLIIFLLASFVHADTVNVPVGQGQAVEVTPSPAAPTPAPTAMETPESTLPPKAKTNKPKPDKVVKDDDDEAEDDANGKGDTYNFYFQKGSGPGSVEQGGGSQKAKPASPPSPSPSTQSRPPVLRDEPEIPAVELQAGLLVGPDGASGVDLGAQFNLTPEWGLNLGLFAENFGNTSTTSSVGSGGISDDSSVTSASGGSVAVTYTPVTFTGGTVPVRISGMAGLMFLSLKADHTYSDIGEGGINSGTTTETGSKLAAFAGVEASAYFTRHFGTVGYFKLASDTRYSQVGVNVAWLF